MGSDDNHSAVPVGLPVFTDRNHCYARCSEDIEALVTPDADFTSSMGNAASVIFYHLNALAGPNAKLHELVVNWCGFYLLTSPTELRLGQFQGKVACQKIKVGKGVCGTSVLKKTHTAVPNVHDVPGHIACDAGSNSEVVVLIRTPTGRIVGLLDIDSTQVGFFSDADIAPLERICNHLGSAMAGKFPIELAPPSGTAIPAALLAAKQPSPAAPAFHVTHATTPTPSTKVEHVAHPSSQTVAPKVTVCEVQGWEFQAVQHDLMLASQQFPALEAQLNVKMLPEVIFADNLLNFVCPLQDNSEAGKGRRVGLTRFTVKALDALAATASAYRTLPSLALPASSAWDKYRGDMQSLDPNIDWAFRNEYCGLFEYVAVDASVPQQLPLAPADPQDANHAVDYDMLRRQDLPIRFFAAFDLYDDDLHDSGESKFVVKARVMDPCFFVLLRHVLRIDGLIVQTRDVRVFHRFGTSVIVLEEAVKDFKLEDHMAAHPSADREALRRSMAREADCAELMHDVSSRTRIVKLPVVA